MRRYETIVIIDPDISEEDRTTLITKTREIIPQQEGAFLQEGALLLGDDFTGFRDQGGAVFF